MFAVPRGNDVAEKVSTLMFFVNGMCILIISVMVFVELASSESTDQLLGHTAIPAGAYIAMLVIMIVSSAGWALSEWYLQRWNRYKVRHNVGYFYVVMLVTTYVLLLIQIFSGRGVFDFIVLIPIFYLPFIFIYGLWAFAGTPQFRVYVVRRWDNWVDAGGRWAPKEDVRA